MQTFHESPLITPVPAAIIEASGIAESKINPGFLWVQEDQNNPTQLYLLAHDGKTVRTISLKGITNQDWEDIALSGNDLYLADIGDNNKAFTSYTFYKFPEPPASQDTVRNIEEIHFRYADGVHNAEAFLIDPESRDIYIFTKSDVPAKIYKLAYPYHQNNNIAELAGVLPYGPVVSAAISVDGMGIIIKTYLNLFYYTRAVKESIAQVLQKSYTTLPYIVEPQGEAVTIALHNEGYFTLSEKAGASEVKLYFYKKR